MQHIYDLNIPQTLEEACDPSHLALLVYDMQKDIFDQVPGLESVIPHVNAVLEAARAAKVRTFFSRHMSMPSEAAGVSQLRTAMVWQRVDKVEDVRPRFIRDSSGFALIPELRPRPSEMVFDKIGMSFFSGTPLNMVLRDAGITTFLIVGTVLEIGIAPTISHGVDLGYIPVVVTDACGSVNEEARKRTLANIEYAQTSLTADTATICRLLSSS